MTTASIDLDEIFAEESQVPESAAGRTFFFSRPGYGGLPGLETANAFGNLHIAKPENVDFMNITRQSSKPRLLVRCRETGESFCLNAHGEDFHARLKRGETSFTAQHVTRMKKGQLVLLPRNKRFLDHGIGGVISDTGIPEFI